MPRTWSKPATLRAMGTFSGRRVLRQATAPAVYLAAKSIYNQLAPSRRPSSLRQKRVMAGLPRRGCEILDGPFQGMRYRPSAFGSQPLPKIVGSYELEIAAAVSRIIDMAPSVVVDVGCAEGYYAVGLARALRETKVIAYDLDRVARYLCRRLAALNQVGDRVEVRGLCTPITLQENLVGAASGAVICDCEGGEDELLRPDKAPALANAVILAELHDFVRPGMGEEVIARFQKTHEIEIFDVALRDPTIIADLIPSSTDARLALDERRSQAGQIWAFMTPQILS